MSSFIKILTHKITLAMLCLLIIVPFIYYSPEILRLTMSVETFRNYILSLGSLGPIIFILFQILQIIIAPIPGEVIQLAGGYIYGIWFGTIYTVVGLLIGAVIIFYFTRFIGGSFIEKLVSKNKHKWIAHLMDNKKISIFLFIIFIIPGTPKDIFIYVAGLTKIKPATFFTILLVARFPWILASVSIGSNLYEQNYLPTIIISAVSLLAFVLGLIYKDKLIYLLSAYRKNNS